jgi:hypothetical protein
MACALPAESGVPLARWSAAELAREAVTRGIVEQISGVTVWRWLSADAIKPWQHRSWIFPRDPRFAEKAGPILDLYQGRWQGERLHPGDYVICADEKPSIQARARKHPTLPAAAGVARGQRVEHEYKRQGALCYLAAWDARRAKLFDRCTPKDGIAPFDALVEQFMSQPPYSKAQRVFVIVDNGSAAPRTALDRPPPRQLEQPTADPHPDPRQLAQPGRDLLLGRATQGPHTQRLPRPRHARAEPARIRPPLRADRRAIRMELHPPRPRPTTRPPQRQRARRSSRGLITRQLYVAELPSHST